MKLSGYLNVILRSEPRQERERNTIKWSHYQMLWLGPRTRDPITSAEVRRGLWIIHFLSPGIKTDTSLESEHWATKTQLSPPWDEASHEVGQSPYTDFHNHQALYTFSLLRRCGGSKKRVNKEKTKTSTTDLEKVNMSGFKTVRVWWVAPLLASVSVVWSSHLRG